MDVSPALTHFGISKTSIIEAVQQVRTYIEQADRPQQASNMINRLIGIDVAPAQFFDKPLGSADVWAMIVTQSIVDKCIKQQCIVDNPQDVVDAAFSHAQTFIMNPMNSWMFTVGETVSAGGEMKAFSSEVNVKVEMKSDGKIKKGGKEVIATALYQKYMADLNGAEFSNQAFIAILMKELGMTKAGSTTYNFNLKKKFNPELVKSKK